MKPVFVQTGNVQRLIAALAELEKRDPAVPGLALVHGHQGYGKTVACQWYAVQNGSIYLRAQAAWTVNWLLMDLAAALGHAPEGISRANFRVVKEELGKRPRLIMLDEADYVIRQRLLLDTVRDLHDLSGAPVCLVGMAGAREAVARKSPQFWSRVSQEVEFQPLSAEDVALIGYQMAGLKLDGRQAREILKRTEGNFRKTVVLLAHVESLRKANPEAELTDQVVERAARRLRAVG